MAQTFLIDCNFTAISKLSSGPMVSLCLYNWRE